ncbi:OadG family protein [Clostridiaceae bacterium M8S5]|nr:OadG family protein [Clostridiaceae bacterium M8S5]
MLGKIMKEGLNVTLLSMGVVFFALILISFMIDLIKVAIANKKKEEIKPEVTNDTVIEEANNYSDDEELVAVISAAVASMMDTSIDNITIRNIKRVPQTTGVWGKMGRQEQIYN